MSTIEHPYPSDLTFGDLIRRNRRNSRLLVAGMGLLAVAMAMAIASAGMIYSSPIGYYDFTPVITESFGQAPAHSMTTPSGVISLQGLLIAGGVAVVIVGLCTMWSYYGGASAILKISGAREIEKADDPQLFNIVEELAIAAGLPVPGIYVIDSPALNAFATGRDPEHAAVAVTRGLRERLTRDELQGVMAHEMAHVRHYDIRLTLLVATLAGLIVLACDVFLRIAFRGGFRSSSRGKGGGIAILIIMLVALLLAIIAPMIAKMMQLAVSRQREYLADAGAVELTRHPKGLADALRKLGGDHTPLERANRATAHLYIDNPFLQAKGWSNWDSAFSTHPPIDERIRRLEALMR